MIRPSEIYGGLADDAREALAAGPIVVSGAPGSCRTELAADIHSDQQLLELRPARAGTAAGLRVDVARELLRFLDRESPGAGPKQFRARLAEAFGPKAGSALASAGGVPGPGLSLADIVDGIPPHALVVVHDAYLLSEPWAERALWTLRARAQEKNPPRLVLLTRPWHIQAVSGRDAPFFGFAETVELVSPDLPRWLNLTDFSIGADDLAWLLEQTRGAPRATLAALRRLEEDAANVREAWSAHVDSQREAAEWIHRLAHGLHPYGPRLLGAIAANERVYPAVPDARSDAIAAALRAMRDHDLIYQPVPRRWVVADPALAPHLVALSRGRPIRDPERVT